MNLTLSNMVVSLDGGDPLPAQVRRETRTERVRADNAVKPDPGWKHVDAHGHYHAFAGEGELPTLREIQEHQPCDGQCGNFDCDGYTTTRYACRICGADVAPYRKPDHVARTTGIPVIRDVEWTIETFGPPPGGTPTGEIILTPGQERTVSVVVCRLGQPDLQLAPSHVVTRRLTEVLFGQLRLVEQEWHFDSDREPYARMLLVGQLHPRMGVTLPV